MLKLQKISWSCFVKKIFILFKFFLVSICIYFFYKLTVENLNTLPILNFSNTLYLILLTSLFTLNSLLLSLAWHAILKASNVKSIYIKNATFYHLTQFGKYFPGNVGQYISRAYYSNTVNISVFKMINFIILESYWLICAAVLSSLFIDFSIIFDNYLFVPLNNFYLKVVLFFAFFCFFVCFIRLLIKTLSKKNIFSFNKIFNDQLSIKTIFFITFNYFFYFVISSFILMLFIVETLNYSNFSFFNFLGIVSISWLLGFIIPGAPAGLGVREYSLVLMLSTIMPISISISCSIIYRLLSLLSDLILFCCAFISKKCLKN